MLVVAEVVLTYLPLEVLVVMVVVALLHGTQLELLELLIQVAEVVAEATIRQVLVV